MYYQKSDWFPHLSKLDIYRLAQDGKWRGPKPEVTKMAYVHKPHWVYVVAGNGAIKVGVSVDVDSRIKTLNTGSATPIALLGSWAFDSRRAALDAEYNLQVKLAEYRLNGEWFSIGALSAIDFEAGLDVTRRKVVNKNRDEVLQNEARKGQLAWLNELRRERGVLRPKRKTT